MIKDKNQNDDSSSFSESDISPPSLKIKEQKHEPLKPFGKQWVLYINNKIQDW